MSSILGHSKELIVVHHGTRGCSDTALASQHLQVHDPNNLVVALDDLAVFNLALADWQISNVMRLGPANYNVPEPATLLIWSLLAGLGIGVGWRRRRKK